MPLIKCEDCGKEISSNAKACIHCGCPVDVDSKNNTSIACVDCGKEFSKNLKSCPACGCPYDSNIISKENLKNLERKSPVVKIIAAILIILLVIGIYWEVNNSNSQIDSRLIGTWVEINNRGSEVNFTYIFNADGTFIGNEALGSYSGTWEISGDTLTLNTDLRLFTGTTRHQIIVEGARSSFQAIYGTPSTSYYSSTDYTISFSENNSEMVLAYVSQRTFRKR